MCKFFTRHKKCFLSVFIAVLAAGIGMIDHTGCQRAPSQAVSMPETIAISETDAAMSEADGSKAEVTAAGETQGYAGYNSDGAPAKNESQPAAQDTADEMLYVYVCGCVCEPGVYGLERGARIYEAIEAAGGMTGEADANSINLAMQIKDQMQIYVPSVSEVQSGTPYPGQDHSVSETGGDAGADIGKININTADAALLDTLPGIGASKAEDIVNYREEHGGFLSIEELMNIPGIKSGIFEKLKDLVTVG